MYDPVRKAEKIEGVVCRGDSRKYRRFRPARFYGGIATADCVGCCLSCVFCWSWRELARPESHGKFTAPGDAAGRLAAIARSKNFTQVRISGHEPTLGREHLIRVLERIPADLTFILETNGILIGTERSFAEELARFPNLHVRVSLKGTCPEEFARLTGAVPEGFDLQLAALAHLRRAGVSVHPACMTSFSAPQGIAALRRRLTAIHRTFSGFEEEELILYPAVEERLRKLKIPYRSAHRPRGIPREQI
jgi:uncharacterized Fe-S cluster-containing radical SAM superfamily protein